MDGTTFLQGINYLKACYVNWQFDLNNDLALKIWAGMFEKLDNDTFTALVKRFAEKSKFPPQSPADLLDVLRSETTKNINPNEAWATVRDLIGRYGFTYHRNELYEAITEPALKRTVKDFESELRYLTDDDTYTSERFKKAYEIYAKREADGQASALIGTTPLRQIGAKQ